MSPFDLDRERGAHAFRTGLPFDERESVGWGIGYGDAATIEPCDPPAEDAE